MGISGLTKVLGDHAPSARKDNEIKNYFGRKVAIDASMSIYQFLIAVRTGGENLTNEDGETTSHLMGLFYRTLRMIDNGIKPVYVFDGKPPTMKSGELAKRLEKRQEAEKTVAEAEEKGDQETADKFRRRTVKVTREHNDDCKKLLRLMGVPYVEAPCEAEAQCAALAKSGKVYAAGSEDMDTLTFGAPVLLRHLTFSEARKTPIAEFHLDQALAGLDLTHDQFIDLCILLGCDYCDSIKGIGPTRAVSLIKEHGSLEKVLGVLDKKKYPVADDWPYDEARRLFKEPEVTDPETIELKWNDPDEEGLVEFMCKKNGFNEERIRNGVKRLQKSKSSGVQGRLDGFFKVTPKAATDGDKKRKADSAKTAPGAKKAKGAPATRGRGRPRK
ncbi:Elongation of fatty acids protein 2 [Allomyces arbusculus]|nr:Elongation of fatty acids protein 2 [Allomyces arbusculus]